MKVMLTGGQQAYGKGKQGARWLANLVGVRNAIDVKPAKTTAERVMDRATYWQGQPREVVHRSVFTMLAERLQVSANDLGSLSARLIEEAAAGYGISEDLLLSQQAEAVAKRYFEDCVAGIQDHLKKQGNDDIRATEKIMADQISAMTSAEKLEIQRALNLQNLSASSLRAVFLKSGVPMAGIAAAQVGGFGTYLALTTVMHAVFTSMLGITLPFAAYTTATSALSVVTGPIGIAFSLSLGALGYFWGRRKIERSQYAMIVFTCIGHAGRSLVPATAALPSVRSYRLLPDGTDASISVPKAEEEDFLHLTKERSGKALATTALGSAQSDSAELGKRVRILQERLQRAEVLLASSAESRSADTSLQNALESLIQGQQKSIDQLRYDLQRATQDAAAAETRLEKQAREAVEAEARYVSRLERRAKELNALWSIHYPNVDFTQQSLRWSAEQDFSGRLEIERALKELSEADDPVTLSRSRMHVTNEHHSRFTIPKNVECRMYYVVSNGRIGIRRMCKEKDC